MRIMVSNIALLITLVSCSGIIDLPSDVDVAYQVTSHVQGIWVGADGLVLRLQANGMEDSLLTIPRDGDLEFLPFLRPGVSYTTMIVNNPLQHTCIIDSGRSGIVTDAGAPPVSISCTGPGDVKISPSPSSSLSWTFDPSLGKQTFLSPDSIFDINIEVSVKGAVMNHAEIDNEFIDIGNSENFSHLLMLPTTLYMELSTHDGLSKEYTIKFDHETERINDCSNDRMRCASR